MLILRCQDSYAALVDPLNFSSILLQIFRPSFGRFISRYKYDRYSEADKLSSANSNDFYKRGMASSAFNVSDLTSKAIDFSWESDNSIEFCYYYLFLSLAELRFCCRRSQEFLIRVGLLGAYLVSIFFYFYYSLSVGFLSSIDSFLTLEMLLIYLF